MKLLELQQKEDSWHLTYGTYLRSDYIKKSLKLKLDLTGIPRYAYFNSAEYGIVEWRQGQGISECHTWEKENAAQDKSFLNYHYPTILMNGQAPISYGRKKIMADIIDDLENLNLRKLLTLMGTEKTITMTFELKDFGIIITPGDNRARLSGSARR